MNYSITVDGGKVAAQINAIVALNTKGHKNLDVVAKNCVLQAIMHRNTTPLMHLVTGLDGTSIYVAGLIKWAVSNGPVKYSRSKGKDGKMAHNFKIDDDKHAKCDLATCISDVSDLPSFWSFAPPPKFKALTLAQELQRLLKKAEKYAEAKNTHLLGEIELSDEQVAAIDVSGLVAYRNFVNNFSKVAN